MQKEQLDKKPPEKKKKKKTRMTLKKLSVSVSKILKMDLIQKISAMNLTDGNFTNAAKLITDW